jgi:inositol oxygenase
VTVFRNYEAPARDSVREFYRLNHRHQTLDFVRAKKREFLGLDRKVLTMWEALELVDTLVDDSDPDLDLGQMEHALQTAEAMRADGRPRWFVVTGLVHDVGKVLCFFGEPQWAVVGDTFPVGCAFSPKIVYPSSSRRTRTPACPNTGLPWASTRRAAASTGCTCRGATTSTSTTW